MIIYPKKLKGEITAPPSKSMAHRAIICASFAEGVSVITNIELSEDMKVTIDAMRKLGAEIVILSDKKRNMLKVRGINGKKLVQAPDIYCNESGSSLRFLIPIALAVAGGGRFTGSGLLPERPLGVYRDLFSSKKIKWNQGKNSLPLEVSGELKSGIYEVPGNVSSQFITGLLFALPLLKGDSEIKITGTFESKQYVDLTVEMLERFGIVINRSENGFDVPGGQKYCAADYSVEGDWSQAAFLVLEGLLGEGINIHGLNENSLQGDMAIVDILKKMNAEIEWREGVLEVKASKLKACDADVSQCPDLAPAIAAAMAVSGGKNKIYGGERLKVKESDRIMSIANALNALGADVTPTDDGMIIDGKNELAGGSAHAQNDHRIAMMVGSVSAACSGEIDLTDEMSVNKSYPSFWEDFVDLGGKIL